MPSQAMPLSYPQAALYSAYLESGDRPFFHGPFLFRVAGELDLHAVREAFRWLTARHPALRTTVENRPDGSVQLVRAVEDAPFVIADVADGPRERREQELRDAVREEGERPFDLAADLPLRVRVHRLGPRDHVLQCTFQHMAIDAWSIGVVAQEFSDAYTAFATGTAPSAPPPRSDYGEFVTWYRSYVEGPEYRTDLEWWRGYLIGAGGRPGHTGGPRHPFRHGWLNLALPPETAVAVRGFVAERGITLYMTCLAAQAVLAAVAAGGDDVLFVTPYSLRLRAEWESVVGWFVNRVILRVRLGSDWTFAELADAVRDTCVDVFTHGRVPFELLRTELGLPADALPVQLSVQNAPPGRGMDLRGATLAGVEDGSGRDFTPLLEVYSPVGAPFRISTVLRERPDGTIAGGVEYDAAAVDRDSALRWHTTFLDVLHAAATDPATPVARLQALCSPPPSA